MPVRDSNDAVGDACEHHDHNDHHDDDAGRYTEAGQHDDGAGGERPLCNSRGGDEHDASGPAGRPAANEAGGETGSAEDGTENRGSSGAGNGAAGRGRTGARDSFPCNAPAGPGTRDTGSGTCAGHDHDHDHDYDTSEAHRAPSQEPHRLSRRRSARARIGEPGAEMRGLPRTRPARQQGGAFVLLMSREEVEVALEGDWRAFRRDMSFRFVSNVDGTNFVEATRDIDPEETLFVIYPRQA